jgi:hypothetical protein
MLEHFIKLLNGLSTVDNGVESVLTPMAYDGLLALTRSVYGDDAAEVVERGFDCSREDGACICVCEDWGEAFAICLTGTG